MVRAVAVIRISIGTGEQDVKPLRHTVRFSDAVLMG